MEAVALRTRAVARVAKVQGGSIKSVDVAPVMVRGGVMVDVDSAAVPEQAHAPTALEVERL